MDLLQKNLSQLETQRQGEEADFLNKLNRFVAPLAILIVLFMIFFGDKTFFTEYHKAILSGRLFGLTLFIFTAITAFLPHLKKWGQFSTALFFAGASIMFAQMTGLMSDNVPLIISWLMVIILFCAIYPLPLIPSFLVGLMSIGFYIVVYISNGDIHSSIFGLTILRVGVIFILSLITKMAISRLAKREFYFRKGLENANTEITELRKHLRDDNVRAYHQLEIIQQARNILLPQKQDYLAFTDLDISGIMIPTAEIGGDFFDVIMHENNGYFAIGTSSVIGLLAGMNMFVIHSALRSLSQMKNCSIIDMYQAINKLIYDYKHRTQDDFYSSLLILQYYGKGRFDLTGQQQSVIVIKKNKKVSEIDTKKLGIFAGVEKNISLELKIESIQLKKGDVIILYSRGAIQLADKDVSKQRLIDATLINIDGNADTIKSAIINSCLANIDNDEINEDISVLVIKKK